MAKSIPMMGRTARPGSRRLAALAVGALALATLLATLAGGWGTLPELDLNLDADDLGLVLTLAGILATGAVVWSGWAWLLLLTLPVTFHGIVLGAQVAW